MIILQRFRSEEAPSRCSYFALSSNGARNQTADVRNTCPLLRVSTPYPPIFLEVLVRPHPPTLGALTEPILLLRPPSGHLPHSADTRLKSQNPI